MRNLLLAVLLLASPAAAIDPRAEPICAHDKQLCADFDVLLTELGTLVPANGEPKKLNVGELQVLRGRVLGVSKRAEEFVYKKKMESRKALQVFGPSLDHIWISINRLSLTGVPLALKDLDGVLSETEASLSRLEKAMGTGPIDDAKRELFALNLALINSEGTRLWRHMQDASLLIDHSGDPITFNPEDAAKPARNAIGDVIETTVNPLQVRVAELSRRIRLLDAKLGGPLAAVAEGRPSAFKKDVATQLSGLLVDPFAKLETVGTGRSVPSVATKGRAAARPRDPPPLPRAPRTLLDLTPAPVVEGEPTRTTWYTGGKRDSEPEESGRVALMHKTGLSKTIGDPKGRALLVYEQTGNTCAIAAQIQVLADFGVVKTGQSNCKKAEDALYDRAVAQDLFRGSESDPLRRFRAGTAATHLAALLDRPAVRRYAATDEELFAAVSRGKLIIATANSGKLWNDPDFANGGHAFVITGAEVSRIGGKVLGYYINDTGTNEGARFITITQFQQAWRTAGAVFVEPQ